MSRKTSNVFRTSFLTMDGTFDPNNSQLFFRALQAPLNTVDNTFYSLGAAQSNDPSLRINKYDASGALLNYGYLYDTQFNPLPPPALLLVAGGIGLNTLIYSTDGQSWIPSDTGLADACLAIAYDGFTWLAGGIDSTGHITMVYSSNGRTWLPNIGGSSLFTQVCSALATNGSLWVGGGRGTDTIIGFSYDRLTWYTSEIASLITGTNISAIAYNGLLWLAGASTYNNGSVPNALVRSSEGIHWSAVDLSGTPMTNVYTICWNGSLWLIGGDLNGVAAIIYSTDGYAWFSSGSATVIPSSIRAISWNGLQFTAGGYDSAGQGRTLAYSYNGVTWTASSSRNMFPYYCNGLTWDGNEWEAVGLKGYTGGFSIATSADGLTWLGNLSGTLALPQGYAIAVNKALPFVAPKAPNPSATEPLSLIAGTNPQFGSGIGYSTDGISWIFLSQVSSITRGARIEGLAWNGTIWVAGVGQQGPPIYSDVPRYPTLIYSYDGITWNGSQSAFTVSNGAVYRIAWGQDKFIGLGSFYDTNNTTFQCVIESPDGINWSRIDSLTTPNVGDRYGIAYNGTTWVLTGTKESFAPAIQYSLDNGVTWQTSASAVATFPRGASPLAWNGRVWSVASSRISLFNDNAGIAYSTDAINWMLGTLYGVSLMDTTSITFNGTMFLLTGYVRSGSVSNNILYSYDGIDYYQVSYVPGDLDTLTWSTTWTGTLWIATGFSIANPTIGYVLYSYNGVYWFLSNNGSQLLTNGFPTNTATNCVNPIAGDTLPPAVLNQGLTPPSGNAIYTQTANNLYTSSLVTLDETNGILGINQASTTYTDLAGTSIQAALEISGGAITENTYGISSTGLFLSANNLNATSGGRIELKDSVNNRGWRIDNNGTYHNHLQITAYDANVGTLCMDFDGSGNVGIGSVTSNAYRLKVDGDMSIVGGTLTPAKMFLIDHPNPALNKTHSLKHSCVEGPSRGDTLYRWTLTTIHNTFVQSLPSYSPYLNENWQFLVRSTNSFGRGYVTLSPCETFFTLTTNQEGTYSILGIATRKDEASNSFEVEPAKYV